MDQETLAMLTTYGPIVVMFALFYFLLIRPQSKERKKRGEMLANLHKGNKVVTIGGIYGEIVELDAKTIMLEIADGVVIKVSRASINANISQGVSMRRDDEDEPAESKDDKKEE